MRSRGQEVVRALVALRHAWADRRLTTRGVEYRLFLLLCVALVGLLTVATVYVVVLSPARVVLDQYDVPDWSAVGGTIEVPGYFPVPRFSVALFSVGLGLAAACLVIAVRPMSAWVRWVTRLFLAFHGLDFGVEVLFSGLGLNAGPLVRSDLGGAWWVLVGISGTAVGAAVLLAVLPTGLLHRRSWWAPVLAAVPFLSYGIVSAAIGTVAVPTTAGISFGPATAPFPDDTTVATWIAYWSMSQVANLSWAAVILLWWQAVEAARGARDLGLGAAAALVRTPPGGALAVILLAKAAVFGVSCANGEGWLGQPQSACEAVRDDGLASIGIASVVVLVAAWWTLRPDRPAWSRRDSRSLVPASWLLIGVLALDSFLGNLAIRVDQVIRKAVVTPLDGDMSWTFSSLFDGNESLWLMVVTILVPGVIGWLLRRSYPGAATLLLVFGLWNAVRAVAVTTGLIQYPWVPWTFESFDDELSGGAGWVDFFTLDAVLTTFLLAAVLLPRGRALTHQAHRHLIPVVLASTVFAYGSLYDLADELRELASGIPVGAAAVVGLVVVFPIGYTMLFDAEWINDPGRRSRRVAGSLALSLMVLAVLVMDPARGSAGVLPSLSGQMLAAPVLLAVLLVGLRETLTPAGWGSAQSGSGHAEAAEHRVEDRSVAIGASEVPADDEHVPTLVDGDEGPDRPR